MDAKTKICTRYAAQLAAIAAIDRTYYLNGTATTADRANYFRRQNDLKQLRALLYAELSRVRHSVTTKPGTFRVRILDWAVGQPVVSAPQCMLAHDLNNYLGAVIGHCELLADCFPRGAEAAKHLSGILESAQKIAKRIRETVCKRENLGSVPDVLF